MAVVSRAIGVYLIFAFFTDFSSGDCFINFPSEPQRVPRYERNFGWRRLEVPYTNGRVDIYADEYINAQCAYGFSFPEYLSKESDISLMCLDRGLQVFTHQKDNDPHYYHMGTNYNGQTFSCSDPNLHVYQSSKSFDWCGAQMDSYFIQAELLKGQNYTLAYLCYDVDAKKLQTITYKTSPKNYADDHNRMIYPSWPNINISSAAGEKVHNFEKVLSHGLAAEELDTEVGKNIWAKLTNYSYSAPVHIGPFASLFSKFNAALDIVWWPNLIHVNWRRFNEALQEHANEVEYTVTTGTSGVAEVPHWNPLTGKLELQEFSFGAMNATVAKYIWSLGISDDRKHSFLVVSYNSPYFNLTNQEETIFCHDICDQYDWLKVARSTFTFPIMGVTFCCSIDEAVDVLEGLPIALINEARAANQTTTSNATDISSTASPSTNIIFQA